MCQGVYSPRIAEDLIPILFKLAQAENKAMTKILDEILRDELHIRGLIDESQARRYSGKRINHAYPVGTYSSKRYSVSEIKFPIPGLIRSDSAENTVCYMLSLQTP